MEPAVQRRHPLRRHGRALARRPRSPSTPPGPHPAARRGLRSRAGCSRCVCAPPRRRTAGYPVIGSQARSARCRPSHCSPAARSITMHTMHCGSAATADAFVPVARSGRRELLEPGITQRSPGHSTPGRTRRRRSPSGSLMIRSWTWEVGPGLRPRKHPIRDSGSRLAARSLPCGILGHHMRSVTAVRSAAG
jgi:hypothetical protein